MKRIAAILLIYLLLFNWIGYKLVISFLQQKADRQIEARIDLNDYDESQLIELRIALNMPYQNTWTEFERHYGQIEIDGKFYNYVKRKIEDGYLILKCLPNCEKQNLQNTDRILFKATNGIDQESNGKTTTPFTNLIKCFFSDYENNSFNHSLITMINPGKNWFDHQASLYNKNFGYTPEQPPESFPAI